MVRSVKENVSLMIPVAADVILCLFDATKKSFRLHFALTRFRLRQKMKIYFPSFYPENSNVGYCMHVGGMLNVVSFLPVFVCLQIASVNCIVSILHRLNKISIDQRRFIMKMFRRNLPFLVLLTTINLVLVANPRLFAGSSLLPRLRPRYLGGPKDDRRRKLALKVPKWSHKPQIVNTSDAWVNIFTQDFTGQIRFEVSDQLCTHRLFSHLPQLYPLYTKPCSLKVDLEDTETTMYTTVAIQKWLSNNDIPYLEVQSLNNRAMILPHYDITKKTPVVILFTNWYEDYLNTSGIKFTNFLDSKLPFRWNRVGGYKVGHVSVIKEIKMDFSSHLKSKKYSSDRYDLLDLDDNVLPIKKPNTCFFCRNNFQDNGSVTFPDVCPQCLASGTGSSVPICDGKKKVVVPPTDRLHHVLANNKLNPKAREWPAPKPVLDDAPPKFTPIVDTMVPLIVAPIVEAMFPKCVICRLSMNGDPGNTCSRCLAPPTIDDAPLPLPPLVLPTPVSDINAIPPKIQGIQLATNTVFVVPPIVDSLGLEITTGLPIQPPKPITTIAPPNSHPNVVPQMIMHNIPAQDLQNITQNVNAGNPPIRVVRAILPDVQHLVRKTIISAQVIAKVCSLKPRVVTRSVKSSFTADASLDDIGSVNTKVGFHRLSNHKINAMLVKTATKSIGMHRSNTKIGRGITRLGFDGPKLAHFVYSKLIGDGLSSTDCSYFHHSIKRISNGLYENNIGEVVSYSTTTTKHHDYYRMLGFDTTFEIPSGLRELCSNFIQDPPDRFAFGTCKEWRVEGDNADIPLVYYNCGPLRAKTCWDVWTKFSGNSMKKFVGIIWDNYSDYGHNGCDRFRFPYWSTTTSKYYYSWKKYSLKIYRSMVDEIVPELLKMSKVGRAIDSLSSKMLWLLGDNHFTPGISDKALWDSVEVTTNEVRDFDIYLPYRQRINEKVPVSIKTFPGLEMHTHINSTDPADVKTTRHVCLDVLCATGDGGEIGAPLSQTHGLIEIEWKNATSTLLNIKESDRMDAAPGIINRSSSTSFIDISDLHHYSLTLCKFVDNISGSNHTRGILGSQLNHYIKSNPRVNIPAAQNLYLGGRNPRPQTVQNSYDNKYGLTLSSFVHYHYAEWIQDQLISWIAENPEWNSLYYTHEGVGLQLHQCHLSYFEKYWFDEIVKLMENGYGHYADDLGVTIWNNAPKRHSNSLYRLFVANHRFFDHITPVIYYPVCPSDDYLHLNHTNFNVRVQTNLHHMFVLGKLNELRHNTPGRGDSPKFMYFTMTPDLFLVISTFELKTENSSFSRFKSLTQNVHFSSYAFRGNPCTTYYDLTELEKDDPLNDSPHEYLRDTITSNFDNELDQSCLYRGRYIHLSRQYGQQHNFGCDNDHPKHAHNFNCDCFSTKPAPDKSTMQRHYAPDISDYEFLIPFPFTTYFYNFEYQMFLPPLNPLASPYSLRMFMRRQVANSFWRGGYSSVDMLSLIFSFIEFDVPFDRLGFLTALDVVDWYDTIISRNQTVNCPNSTIDIRRYSFGFTSYNYLFDDHLSILHPNRRPKYLGGIRRSKGKAITPEEWALIPGLRKSKRLCVSCRLHAPKKYRWVKGYCQTCVEMMEDPSLNPYSHELSRNLYWSQTSTMQFKTPILMAPANPYYKPKPIRDNLRCENDFGTGIGWRSIGKNVYKISSPSQLIGPTVASIARVLNFSTGVEVETLKTRAFAKPLSQGIKAEYDKLYDFLIRFKMLGEKNCYLKRGAIPFCIYDFSKGGPVYADLKHLGLLGSNPQHTMARVKSHIDIINARLWNISPESWAREEKLETWITGFPPNKRKKYWQALITDVQYTNIKFKIFLKREIQPHGSYFTGYRSPANPRIIFDPSPISQIYMGPILRSATRLLHEIQHLDSNLTYFGGLSPGHANLWARKYVTPDFQLKFDKLIGGLLRIIENDFSKMDSCYGPACFLFVYAVYSWWGLPVENEVFMSIMKQWEKPKGAFRSGTRVRAPSMNASGRADTALMNALINSYVQFASYIMVKFDKSLDQITDAEFQQFNERFCCGLLGDDSLVITDEIPDMANKVSQKISLFGFEANSMKVWSSAKFATFLGQRLYPTTIKGQETVSWGPTIGRRLYRFGHSCDRQQDPLRWLKLNCFAASISHNFVPILSDIVQRCSFLLSHVSVTEHDIVTHMTTDDNYKYKMMFKQEEDVLPDWNRMPSYLNEVYNLDLSNYWKFQKELEHVWYPTVVFNHPWMHALIQQDVG